MNEYQTKSCSRKIFSVCVKNYQTISAPGKRKKEFVLSKQVLKSGTAIGAMIEEAIHAESKADFIHKLSVAYKEANETHYWIRLLRESQFLPDKPTRSLLLDNEEIIKLLARIILTTKRSMKKA